MPRYENPDLSTVADRVQAQTWSVFQTLRTRIRQLKGVSMKVQYESQSHEPIPSFYYEGRQLFHLHTRAEEINATLHTDYKSKPRIVDNQAIDWRLREQVRKKTFAAFTLKSVKDLGPFMELVRAKYQLINEEVTGKPPDDRPVAV